MLRVPFEPRHAATVNVKPRGARCVTETPYAHSLHGCCLLCPMRRRIAMRPEPEARGALRYASCRRPLPSRLGILVRHDLVAVLCKNVGNLAPRSSHRVATRGA